MSTVPSILVCFALRHEAHAFLPIAPEHCRVLLTGIGQPNAYNTIRRALSDTFFKLVLSCGFAGGLRPDLKSGTLVYDADNHFPGIPALQAAGVQPARFHCADRIIARTSEKALLWRTTGADAVDMESAAIRACCHHDGIPSATLRVISDAAHEDLPLDFSTLLTSENKIDYSKMALTLLKAPQKIRPLLAFHRQTRSAAQILARALQTVLLSLEAPPSPAAHC